MRILAVNPGGTSTKISVFDDSRQIVKENITHSQKDLEAFEHVVDQMDFRKNKILKTLAEHKIELNSLDAVSGRGGLMKAISGGTYPVNDAVKRDW